MGKSSVEEKARKKTFQTKFLCAATETMENFLKTIKFSCHNDEVSKVWKRKLNYGHKVFVKQMSQLQSTDEMEIFPKILIS